MHDAEPRQQATAGQASTERPPREKQDQRPARAGSRTRNLLRPDTPTGSQPTAQQTAGIWRRGLLRAKQRRGTDAWSRRRSLCR